jgi:arginine decarboxylase
MKPVSKVVVVIDEPSVLESFVQGFNQAAQSLENPFGIVFVGASTAIETLQLLELDGDVQCVILDDKLSSATGGSLELIARIGDDRPELDVFVLISKEREDEVVKALFDEAVSGYFYREERDYRGIYRIVSAQIGERFETPFYDALKTYVQKAIDSWHTPGHSSGDSLRVSPWASDFYEFMGEHAFDADLSVSVKSLDSLLEPTGVILEAQQKAARAFGAKKTFFATNGTSTANKVIFQSILAPGDKLLLDRNCHKSVHHGVVLSGANPVYLDSSINRRYGMFGPIPKKTLLEAIKHHPDAEALILTSCTYDGLRYDLRPIIEAAHSSGIKVIVDEAWYGFARFHPAFRPTALESGADYATQSTHKTLSALSQAAMIHVADPDFDEHQFRENFNMHTSTSPQYTMLASLDVGRMQAELEGYKMLQNVLEYAKELREDINSTGVFRVLELQDLLPEEVLDDGILLDPTKITVDISMCGYTVEELQEVLFERYSIQVEKSTFNTITLLLTIGTTRSKCSRLFDALARIAREKRVPKRAISSPEIPQFTSLKFLPRDAFYVEGELVPLLDENDHVNTELQNRVSADQIVPYPPGIPVLVPGQVVTLEIAQYLARMLRLQKRIELHGVVFDGYVPCLRVVKLEEESGLKAL